jgi:hypothetical protein
MAILQVSISVVHCWHCVNNFLTLEKLLTNEIMIMNLRPDESKKSKSSIFG